MSHRYSFRAYGTTMITIFEVLFWVFAMTAIYPYVLYPILLTILSRLSSVRREETNMEPPAIPRVTIIVSARDEEVVIEDKIRTSLAIDYPAESLEVVIVSDASTDRTNEIVEKLSNTDARVKLVAIKEHLGKTAGLNQAMTTIESDIVVFTDANAIFDKNAVNYLVDELRRPGVGYVVGSALYTRSKDMGAGENEGLYWRYELAIKRKESEFESVVGGDGAIYAIWRHLYQPLAPEDINDFMNPLQIVVAGYRGVFSPEAKAYEDPADDYDKEFRRKRRIVCRTWGAILRFGFRRIVRANLRFGFMLVSHKIVRWFTMASIALAIIFNALILIRGGPGLYVLTAGLIVGSIVLAIVGWRRTMSGRDAPFYCEILYYFYLSNLAAILGIFDYWTGNRYVTWEHVRTQT